jgi:hypothetical protein
MVVCLLVPSRHTIQMLKQVQRRQYRMSGVTSLHLQCRSPGGATNSIPHSEGDLSRSDCQGRREAPRRIGLCESLRVIWVAQREPRPGHSALWWSTVWLCGTSGPRCRVQAARNTASERTFVLQQTGPGTNGKGTWIAKANTRARTGYRNHGVPSIRLLATDQGPLNMGGAACATAPEGKNSDSPT